MTDAALRTPWTEALGRGDQPDAAALRAHLRTVHRDHAGFTESAAGQCRDVHGRTSYDWLSETIDPARHAVVLDVACGSGALLARCHATLPAEARLLGVDMSPDELALAHARLPDGRAELIDAQAQHLDFLADASVDLALCHWALTLMDPVAPVLDEMRRVLKSGGRFAALVDGPADAAPAYAQVHDLIYGHVQAETPGYGAVDLGDPRVRSADSLSALVRSAFPGAAVRVETNVVTLSGPGPAVAQEAAGFFYAAFVLSAARRRRMLEELADLLRDDAGSEAATFAMPVNRLVVDLPHAG